MWWNVGHALNEASEILANPAHGFSQSYVVGEPVAGLVNADNVYHQRRRNLISEMLYSFAVENWLKGLLVASFARSSKEKQREIDVLLDDLLREERAEDNYTELLLRTIRGEAFRPHMEELETLRADEDKDRTTEVKKYGHGLRKLAHDAGVTLDGDLTKYLEVLEVVNQLGRYSMHKFNTTADLDTYVGNADLRKRLGKVIRERYDEVS